MPPSRRDFLKSVGMVSAKFALPGIGGFGFSEMESFVDNSILDQMQDEAMALQDGLYDITDGHDMLFDAVRVFLGNQPVSKCFEEDGRTIKIYASMDEAFEDALSIMAPGIRELQKVIQSFSLASIQPALNQLEETDRVIESGILRKLSSWIIHHLPEVICDPPHSHEIVAAAARKGLGLASNSALSSDDLNEAWNDLRNGIRETPNLPYGYDTPATNSQEMDMDFDTRQYMRRLKTIVRIARKNGVTPSILNRADEYRLMPWNGGMEQEPLRKYTDIFGTPQQAYRYSLPSMRNAEELFDKMIGAPVRYFSDPKASIFRNADPERIEQVVDAALRFGHNVTRAYKAENSATGQYLYEQAIYDPRSEDTEAVGRPVFRSTWMPRGNDYY